MKFKIIIVDDEHESRRDGYERLVKEINLLDSSFIIEIDFVQKPNDLQVMLQRNHYSGAIVDAVLDILWKDFSITNALKIIGSNIPIAIVSDRWDRTNTEQIDEALKMPNCRTFLHWRDLDKNGKGQIDYAIRAFQSMIADHKKLDIQYNLRPEDPIRILHISDVQTGGFNYKNLKLEANRCADIILKHCNDCPPSFVAFTGDVAENGMPSQYDAAYEWIGYFFNRLNLNNLPARNLLYVPGNHDVNLSLAAGARVKLALSSENRKKELLLADDVIQPDLIGYAFIPFRNFLKDICDCPLMNKDISDHNFAWVDSRFRHLGVIFYGINTAQPANAFGLPGRQVQSDALAQINVELNNIVKSCESTPPLVIGIGHHCPISAKGEDAVENPEDFEKFFRGRVKTALFLHGHLHHHDLCYTSNDNLRLVRSCATTLTKMEDSRPSDSLRGFNLLNLERKNHVITSLKAFSYGWIGSEIKQIKNGEWKLKDDGMFKES